jgi:hypothetical protein
MRKALLVVPIVMIVGCTIRPNFEMISVGWSKEQVRAALGKPDTIATQGKTEYWNYQVLLDGYLPGPWHFVRFIDGKVESFGQKGDFDSTKDPTQKIIIDKTDKITMDSVSKFDLATELAKLDKLKKDGLITAEDYELLKKRAIEKAKE